MGKMIDADELRNHWLYDTVGNEPEFTPNDVLDSIDEMPAVDAVPVIRCRDCRRHKYGKFCDRTGVNAGPDDFCSYAEPVNKPVESVDNHGN